MDFSVRLSVERKEIKDTLTPRLFYPFQQNLFTPHVGPYEPREQSQ